MHSGKQEKLEKRVTCSLFFLKKQFQHGGHNCRIQRHYLQDGLQARMQMNYPAMMMKLFYKRFYIHFLPSSKLILRSYNNTLRHLTSITGSPIRLVKELTPIIL